MAKEGQLPSGRFVAGAGPVREGWTDMTVGDFVLSPFLGDLHQVTTARKRSLFETPITQIFGPDQIDPDSVKTYTLRAKDAPTAAKIVEGSPLIAELFHRDKK